jgi:hypothetical protein
LLYVIFFVTLTTIRTEWFLRHKKEKCWVLWIELDWGETRRREKGKCNYFECMSAVKWRERERERERERKRKRGRERGREREREERERDRETGREKKNEGKKERTKEEREEDE